MLSGRNAAGDVIPGDASLQLCTLVLLLLLSDWSATLYLKATLSFFFFFLVHLKLYSPFSFQCF